MGVVLRAFAGATVGGAFGYAIAGPLGLVCGVALGAAFMITESD